MGGDPFSFLELGIDFRFLKFGDRVQFAWLGWRATDFKGRVDSVVFSRRRFGVEAWECDWGTHHHMLNWRSQVQFHLFSLFGSTFISLLQQVESFYWVCFWWVIGSVWQGWIGFFEHTRCLGVVLLLIKTHKILQTLLMLILFVVFVQFCNK